MAKTKITAVPFLLLFTIAATFIPTLLANTTGADAASGLHPADIVQRNGASRRQLAGKKIRMRTNCSATNPIDQCWRCQKHWAAYRKALADCAIGFGKETTGGKNGEIYVVTDPSDHLTKPAPGTLRYGVTRMRPMWIVFASNMKIKLHAELIIQGHKTIDGRGALVEITGGSGFKIQHVTNVIIHNIHIRNIVESNGAIVRDSENHVGRRDHDDGDGISIFNSTRIWIDHVSMQRCTDGLIDAIRGSTDITISNSHFMHHDKMIAIAKDFRDVIARINADAKLDKNMRVTVAFNNFGRGLVQRIPRCRAGFFHLVNNMYTYWELYAIGGSDGPTIISQGNRFNAPADIKKKEVTSRPDSAGKADWRKWTWITDDDWFTGGAEFVPSGEKGSAAIAKYAKLYNLIKPYPKEKINEVTAWSGTLSCRAGIPC